RVERRFGIEPHPARVLSRSGRRAAEHSRLQYHGQQPHAETGTSIPVAGDRNDVRSTPEEAGTVNARLEARTDARSVYRLGQRALSLGAANAFDYILQFLLPVVLVRCLDPTAFGQYRLVWLAAGTVMAVVTQAMPGSLYYYLPRSDGAAKRLYINQTLLFLASAGAIGALAVSPWNPWLPEKLGGLARHEAMLPAFVMLWVVGALLDLLP